MRAITFDVKLLPCGLRATVVAPDILCAVESLRLLSPANEALVERLSDGSPDDEFIVRGSRVEFGRECAVHFVGFRGDEYHSAVRLWGRPDFFHRAWDQRAQREIGPGDLLVFAKYGPDFRPSPFNYDDSNEDDDPAAAERKKFP